MMEICQHAGPRRERSQQKRIHQPNVGSMLSQRRKRWTRIEPTLG